VAKLRELARRARHMAPGLTQPSDRLNLERYAEEFEQRAAKLEEAERVGRSRAPPDQQQIQQQQQASSPEGEKKK
jgi:hypothetical protein